MRKSLSIVGVVVVAVALAAGITSATGANSPQKAKTPAAANDLTQAANSLTAPMSGGVEVPAGDTDANGNALVMTNASEGLVCFKVVVGNVDPIVAAHIHKAPAGQAGPVVIPLLPAGKLTTDGANQTISGCTQADPALVADLEANAAQYYVNVHNAAFPAGAARGQLTLIPPKTITKTVTKTKTKIVRVCPKKKKKK
jgi:hypothetical protein